MSLTQASYPAVAPQGLNALTTYAAVTQVTYSAVESPGGATVLTRDDPVTL